MNTTTLESIKAIEQQYHTGEEPVLVLCSDMNTYVCKYMRTSSSAYKLACEWIGSQTARIWQIATPEVAFVRIKQSHWAGRSINHNISAPSLGSKWMDGVVDVTPSTYGEVDSNVSTLSQLMKIALFDFWIANEDRNANNANLLYDIVSKRLISIDYGCILNTATFDYPLSQLTSTDTILWSDLFKHLSQGINHTLIDSILKGFRLDYAQCLNRSRNKTHFIAEELPNEWHVPREIVLEKMNQLTDYRWSQDVWENFVECLKENLEYE